MDYSTDEYVFITLSMRQKVWDLTPWIFVSLAVYLGWLNNGSVL